MNSTRAKGMHDPWLAGSPPAVRFTLLVPALLIFSAGASALAEASVSKRPARPVDPAQQADLFPSTIVVSAPDLLLTPEKERQSDALAAFILGSIAEDDADDDAALAHYRKTLALDPAQTDLAIKVAYELVRRGSIADGINVLKDNIKAVPNNAATQLFLSQLYAKYLKKYEPAIAAAARAQQIDPANFNAYLALYELYTLDGQKKKAAETLERVNKLPHIETKLWLQLGQLQGKLTMKDGQATPESDLAKLNITYEKALAAAQPGDRPALTAIADFYAVSRQVKKAIPLYEKLLADTPADDNALLSLRDKLGRCYRIDGQRDKAIATLEQLVATAPERYDSFEMLGEMYEEAGDTTRSLARYAQTLKIEPNQPATYLRMANLYLKNQRQDEALKTLQAAHQQFPDLPKVTYYLAITLAQAKQFELATTMFDDAESSAQDTQQDMLDAQFYLTYGSTAEQAGQIDKAVKMLRKSIALDPPNAAEAANYLGFMWVDRNEHLDEGGALIQRALKHDPDNPAYLDSLGWFYYRKGQFDKAVTILLQASERLQPSDPVVTEHVADAYAKLNNLPKALEYWQRASALAPESKTLPAKIEDAKKKLAAPPAPSPAPSPTASPAAAASPIAPPSPRK